MIAIGGPSEQEAQSWRFTYRVADGCRANRRQLSRTATLADAVFYTLPRRWSWRHAHNGLWDCALTPPRDRVFTTGLCAGTGDRDAADAISPSATLDRHAARTG